MGGLGPGIGGLEYVVIGIVALVVVGPERLPGLLRQLGKMVAKARGMANEFRSSFDEMARQSELDELRKEVEALRLGQGEVGQGMVRLGEEADAAFKDIRAELEQPTAAATASAAVTLNAPEFPEPVMTPLNLEVASKPKVARPAAAKPKIVKAKAPAAAATPEAAATTTTRKAPAAKPARARAPRNTKLDL